MGQGESNTTTEQNQILARLARWLVRMRWPILLLSIAATIFFAYQATKLKLSANLDAMLPQTHPYVKTHNEIRKTFGGINSFAIEVEVANGTIFNHDTLTKVKDITDKLFLFKGMNKYKVLSIAAEKAKRMNAGAWGMMIKPLMEGGVVPADDSPEMRALRHNIHSDDRYYGTLVSLDDRSALIIGEYYDHYTDYLGIYHDLESIRDQFSGPNTQIYITGPPFVLALVRSNLPKMFVMFGVTLGIILVLFYVYFRSIRGMLAPVLAALASVIWSLGFAGMRGIDLDPMTIIVPFLVLAIGASHCAQKTKRFFDEYGKHPDSLRAAEITLEWLLWPAISALVTDVAAFASLLTMPIPMVGDMALVSTVGIASVVFADLALVPLLFAILPPSLKAAHKVSDEDALDRWMQRMGAWVGTPRGRRMALGIGVVAAAVATPFAAQVKVGDILPGSPIFWASSRYNRDAAHINERFLGADYLYVVAEGKGENYVLDPATLKTVDEFERYLELDPRAGGAFSVADILKLINQKLHEDDPKWAFIPDTKQETMNLMYVWWSGTNPGDLDRYMNANNTMANVTILAKDHTGDTCRSLIARAKDFIAAKPLPGGEFRLAGGVIGVQAAVDEVVAATQLENIVEMLVVVFICVFFLAARRNVFQTLATMAPLVVGLLLMFGFMQIANIDLNINSLPIASLGIGIGVDYAIYMLSRLQDEDLPDRDESAVVAGAMPGTGKTILFTAVTFTMGVLTWWASGLRFNALMGALLGFLFMICMIGALMLTPAAYCVWRSWHRRREAVARRDSRAATVRAAS